MAAPATSPTVTCALGGFLVAAEDRARSDRAPVSGWPSDPTPDRRRFVSAVRTQPRNRRAARDRVRVRPLDARA
jgi:hypothetical protein